MKKELKVFIATSSFSAHKNFDKINKNIKFVENPLKRKLTSKELIKFAQSCQIIIAGTETYNKITIDNLVNLRFLYRLGSGIDNVDIDYLKKKKLNLLNQKNSRGCSCRACRGLYFFIL